MNILPFDRFQLDSEADDIFKDIKGKRFMIISIGEDGNYELYFHNFRKEECIYGSELIKKHVMGEREFFDVDI